MLARAAAPTAVLLVLPLTMNWSVTVHGLVSQATYPSLNRPTPWLHFAPSLGHGGYIGATAVAATGDGPSRFLAILFSLIVGILFRRAARELGVLIAVVALSLSLWCVWPTIAVALIGLSATSRLRTAASVVFAILADLASNADLHAEWVWWVIVSALAALLAASWPQARARSSEPTAVDAPCSVGMVVVGTRPLTNNDC